MPEQVSEQISRREPEEPWRYLIALGSNRWHPKYGAPRKVLVAALERLEDEGLRLIAQSATIGSDPLGPSARRYANSVVVIETNLCPLPLLGLLKSIEQNFGRMQTGRRWSARVLDLDIILWSGGRYSMSSLTIPHIEFRRRDFVLGPAATIAGDWRDPVSGFTVRQLFSRLTRADRLPR